MKPEIRNRFRITSIIIAIVMLVGAFGVLISPFTVNVSATITGNTYSGSGNWVITSATVYTDETLTVYGNIYINTSGSLTLLNTSLTMDEPSPSEHIVIINGVSSFMKIGKDSIFTCTNATAGKVNTQINVDVFSGHLYISNATVEYTGMYQTWLGKNDYIDNSTLKACSYVSSCSATFTDLNISYNTWKDINNSFVIVNYIHNSWITGNRFENITQYTRDGGGLNAIIINDASNVAGAYDTHIIKNHFVSPVQRQGICALVGNGVIIERNVFENISAPAHDATDTAIGIKITGEGIYDSIWSSINNNTFKMIYSTPAVVPVQPSRGILGVFTSQHYEIVDNQFWTIKKTTDNAGAAMGIEYLGSIARINRNFFGNVTGTIDDVWGCPAGIQLTHPTGGDVYIQSGIQVENNTLLLVQGASNGICVWGSGTAITNPAVRTTLIRFANNTFGTVRDASNAIGIYANVDNVTVADNVILDVHRNGAGIGMANNITFTIVARNTINGSNEEPLSTSVSWAIALAYESNSRCGQGVVFENNSINIANRNGDYRDFSITRCYLKSPAPIIYTQQDLVIYYEKSNFTVRGSSSHLPMLDDNGTYANSSVSGEIWTKTFSHWSYSATRPCWLNVTLSNIAVAGDLSSFNLTSLVVPTWTADGATAVTFTLSGLESGRMYKVYIDGAWSENLIASGGAISFTYSGPWSEHEFEIVYTSVGPKISLMVNVIFMMVALGIVLAVMGETVSSFRKKPASGDEMIRRLLNMVIYIVIGLVMLGALYAVIS